jgi:Zn-dependent protease with chaperone function
MAQRGLWFDGRIATSQTVEALAEGGALRLRLDGGDGLLIESGELVKLESPPGQVRLGHRSLEGWRLLLDQPLDAELARLVPARAGSLGGPLGRRKLAVLVSLSAVVSAAVGMVIFAPERLARHMPMSWERRLGSAYDVPIEAVRCDRPGVQPALDALVDRLDPAARRDGFTLELVDLGVANAVALPGGRMVLFDGLFAQADNPEAIAGIVAHEIAHVRRRHVAAAMIRDMGLSTVVTLLGGGALAGNAGDLLSLKFSRTAEAEADQQAIAMLRASRIDPRPTATAFDRFRKLEGQWPEWLASHPPSADRARRFDRSWRANAAYDPALSSQAWEAVKNGCG